MTDHNSKQSQHPSSPMDDDEIHKQLTVCFNHIHSKVKASNSSGEAKYRATLSSTNKHQSLSDKDSGKGSNVSEPESGFKSDGDLKLKVIDPYVSCDRVARASLSVGTVQVLAQEKARN